MEPEPEPAPRFQSKPKGKPKGKPKSSSKSGKSSVRSKKSSSGRDTKSKGNHGHRSTMATTTTRTTTARARKRARGRQLWHAAKKGDVAAIERLAAKGASPNAKKYGVSAVLMAVVYGHAGAAAALVRLGADLNARDGTGWTALMVAARNGKPECARALLAGGADRTLRATGGRAKGKTALEIAEANGKAQVAALLR
eukprot:COSAG04_NODE_266_length_18562_cov_11.848995_1_plen_197_part_00